MLLSYAVDIMIALIAVGIIIYYTVRGFIRSLFDAVKLIASVVISYFAVPALFPLTDPTVRIVLYIITFLIVLLLLSLVFTLIDRIIKKIPVIRSANRFMGFLLGVGFAYLFISSITILLWILDSYVSGGVFGMTHEQLQLESMLFRFFSRHGAFSIFM